MARTGTDTGGWTGVSTIGSGSDSSARGTIRPASSPSKWTIAHASRSSALGGQENSGSVGGSKWRDGGGAPAGSFKSLGMR